MAVVMGALVSTRHRHPHARRDRQRYCRLVLAPLWQPSLKEREQYRDCEKEREHPNNRGNLPAAGGWVQARRLQRLIAIAKKRAGFRMGPLRKGAAVIGVVAAALAQGLFAHGLVEGNARMAERF